MLGHIARPATTDHVKEVLGDGASALAPAELRVRQKQLRLAYGQELQQQMTLQAEARKRERMERMGIPVTGSPQAYAHVQQQGPAPGQLTSAAYDVPAAVMGSMPSYPPMVHASDLSPQHQGARRGHAPPQAAAPPQQPVFLTPPRPDPMGGTMMPPGRSHVLPWAAQPPAQPGRAPWKQDTGPGHDWNPGPGPASASPQRHTSYAFPAPGQLASAAPVHAPAQYSPGLGGIMASTGVDRAAQRAQQDAYRAALDAQVRANQTRKQLEREYSQQQERQVVNAAQEYAHTMSSAMMARPGVPMPVVTAPQPGLHGLGAALSWQQPAPHPFGSPASHMPIPIQQQAMAAGLGPGGQMPSMLHGLLTAPSEMTFGPQFGGPMGPSPHTIIDGGGLNGVDTGNVAPRLLPNQQQPVFRFRSDQAYLTPDEITLKARQKAELQEALEKQIAEKKWRKEQERAAKQAEEAMEEARLRAQQEQLQAQSVQDQMRERDNEGATREEQVAAAWARAKAETEQAKKRTFEERRQTLSHQSRSIGGDETWPQPAASHPANLAPNVAITKSQASAVPAPTAFGTLSYAAAPSGPPATPPAVVAERIRVMAEQEVQKVREELKAEAAHLRSIVTQQGAQVAALQQHTSTLESTAQLAQSQVSQMRRTMMRSSVAAPESLMHILGAYTPLEASQTAVSPPIMPSVDLDLPPTAALQRRTLAQPYYDMGPLIPPSHNPATIDPNLQRAFLDPPGAQLRPSTQGLRTINPLEASLAAESLLIYPGGREVVQNPSSHAAPGQLSSAAPGDLPFRSLSLAPGQLTGADGASAQQAGGPTSPGDMMHQTSAVLSPGRAHAALLSAGYAIGGMAPQAPIPSSHQTPAQHQQVHAQGDGSQPASTAPLNITPLDVPTLMQQNERKLSLLKELTSLSQANSVEAIDAFLSKFSKQRPGLPERTHTPVFRVNTPMRQTGGNGSAVLSIGAHHSSFPQTSTSTGMPAASGTQQPIDAPPGSTQSREPLGQLGQRTSEGIMFTNNHHPATPSVPDSQSGSFGRASPSALASEGTHMIQPVVQPPSQGKPPLPSPTVAADDQRVGLAAGPDALNLETQSLKHRGSPDALDVQTQSLHQGNQQSVSTEPALYQRSSGGASHLLLTGGPDRSGSLQMRSSVGPSHRTSNPAPAGG